MKLSSIRAYLFNQQLVSGKNTIITPLSGGVSSEIYLVEEEEKAFVVKKALPKLKVEADWYADVSRNTNEQAYLRYVHQFLPEHVPAILHSDASEGLFIMEYLGTDFVNWKAKLLRKEVDQQHTLQAAQILSSIHRKSWDKPKLKEQFDTTKNFFELRLEPYLLATAKKHPKLKTLFEQEVERLSHTQQCLVHGDFSPKNILVHPDRMIILDCEVAWYGDPTFDLAFLLNHFLLKSLYFQSEHAIFIQQIQFFWNQYIQSMGGLHVDYHLEAKLVHLLPMLLLARIDGKSPVEYLDQENQKELVRNFVKKQLAKPSESLEAFIFEWQERLDRFTVQG